MDNMEPASSQADPDWPELRQQRRAIVVVDVVESVRLMQANEADVIDRWRRFVNEVRTQVLPVHGGRLVKSLGDGLLLEFESVRPAIAAALDMQTRIGRYNIARSATESMHLRLGANEADVVIDADDVYGSGVNLAARLATLARPGEVVVSSSVRDALTDGLDADLEDLGECYLKNLSEPVRAFRLAHPAGAPRIPKTPANEASAYPTIAVIPLRADLPDHRLVGDALADEIIAGLSKSDALRVISRLSTSAMAGREFSLAEVAARLGADYVLSGSVRVDGTRLSGVLELADAARGAVLWADSLRGDVHELFGAEREVIGTIVGVVSKRIINHELGRARSQPLPTLRSYSLLLGAITLMHRTAASDFDKANLMLQHLIERDRQHPRPHAWLANWHALRVTQGHSTTATEDTNRAMEHARRALDLDPRCALALAIDGVLQINLLKDMRTAEVRLNDAVEADPNESLAWLFKGLLHGFKGEGESAEHASARALALSPLDPMRHYYDSLAASAALGAMNYGRAVELAQRSMRANRMHASTYRALAIAQAMMGDHAAAGVTVRQLLALAPGYTVSTFRSMSGFSAGPLGNLFADALRDSGLPA